MSLADLEPRWLYDEATIVGVAFDCPEHADCPIRVPFLPFHEKGWTRTGDRLEDLTLGPSIRSSCGFHGWVRLGRVELAPDSK